MKKVFAMLLGVCIAVAEEAPKASINGTEYGWKDFTQADFTNVNCHEDTWVWSDNAVSCNGKPVGVIRTTTELKNFELICEWKHLKPAGNAGIFAWVSAAAIADVEAGKGPLPSGIEVQVLDPAFEDQWEKKRGKKADWFTGHGDIFPTGTATMIPFKPSAPNGKRAFPRQRLTKPAGEWNHYYIRAINGEIRLWVNGVEVSGGHKCQPATGFLCLESEGSPIEFRHLRLRILP